MTSASPRPRGGPRRPAPDPPADPVDPILAAALAEVARLDLFWHEVARRALAEARADARARAPGVLDRLCAAGWRDAATALLRATIDATGGNRSAAGRALRVSEDTVYRAERELFADHRGQ